MSNTNKKENEKKDVNKNVEEVKGELTYENKVIQKIIGFSLENISGLLAVDGGFFSNLTDKIINTDNVTSGVNVEVGKEQVAVDLNIIVEYKKNVPELYQEIKKVITNDISNITDLEVVEVNVNVVDIKTKEQHEADSVSLQDRVTNAVESTGEFASEKFEAAKTGISDGLSTAKEKVEDGVEAVKDKVNDDDKEDEKGSKSKEKKRVQ
ncbi:Asp23/Gls24 family envelope stress response protein [Gemella sanguinis]